MGVRFTPASGACVPLMGQPCSTIRAGRIPYRLSLQNQAVSEGLATITACKPFVFATIVDDNGDLQLAGRDLDAGQVCESFGLMAPGDGGPSPSVGECGGCRRPTDCASGLICGKLAADAPLAVVCPRRGWRPAVFESMAAAPSTVTTGPTGAEQSGDALAHALKPFCLNGFGGRFRMGPARRPSS